MIEVDPVAAAEHVARTLSGCWRHAPAHTICAKNRSRDGKSIHQSCFQLGKLKFLNRQKRGLMYTKKLVFKGKEGKYIYTKEASRCLWWTPSRSVGV